MKIAHIVSTYPPYYGGMGNVVFQTVEQLAGRGHDVYVFTPGYHEPAEVRAVDAPHISTHAQLLREEMFTVRRLSPSLRYGNAARLPQLARELDDMDVVHLHYPFFGSARYVRKWKQRHPNRALVITYHMDTRGSGWKGLIFQLYTKFWMPRVLGAADALIGSSFDYVHHSDASMLYRDAPSVWHELPFGVDIDRFFPRRRSESLMHRHGLNPDLPTVLFVGGMDSAHYFKGVPDLIKALFLLRKSEVPVQALLVGDGNLRPEFERQAHALQLNAAYFVGRVSDAELPEYYALGDLCVLPSTTVGEAFGMVLLEAMASGIPVLASDLPGVRVVAGKGGDVVPVHNPAALADEIASYFSQKDLIISQMRSTARAVAEREYAWPDIVERLEGIYKKAIAAARLQ